MQVICERCAAVDVGKDEIAVAVRVPGKGRDRRKTEKRTYRAFYGVLREMARWLESQDVTHVAMEATGSYSMPVCHALMESGFEQVLVCNAGHVKNVPGRKTDPFTELRREVPEVSGWVGMLVVTVAGHDHKRRCTAGPVAAGGAAARVA